VADRFHLIKNVREKLKELLDRKRTCLPWREEKGSVPALQHPLTSAVSSVAHDKDKSGKRRSSTHKQIPAQITGEHTDLFQTANERRRALNREKRYALYEEVRALRQQGLSHYAIADALGLSRPTVRRFLEAEDFPERCDPPRSRHKSIVAPYLPFLSERWLAGCHNGRQLFREAKARGYGGSPAQLERVTTQWRKQLPALAPTNREVPSPPPAPLPKRQRLSPQQASWYFVLAKERLTTEQQQEIEGMCQASHDLALAYELSQDFIGILKEQKAHELNDWLRRARNCQVTELRSIAKSMQQDYAAIFAACSQPWSQGQVEGQINRLKCLKRQMYGRARFDLLRLRVLKAS
jgi:transposase